MKIPFLNTFANSSGEDKESKENLDTDSIFHVYDIRGSYPEEINEKVFFNLASSIIHFLKSRKIIVCRDSRRSSISLAASIIKAALMLNIKVIDAGMTTTPLASWLARKHKADAFMVTASHNDPQDNGLKIYSYKKGPIHKGNGLEKIEQIYKEKSFTIGDKIPKLSLVTKRDFINEYKKDLLAIVGKIKFKSAIAVDFSNGTASLVLGDILEELGISFTTLNEDPNSNFPGHGPNPLHSEAQKQISLLIGQGNYRLGALFDGDGDRVVFFDEGGSLIPPEQITALLIDYILPKVRRFKNVVVTIPFSRIAEDIARKNKGRVYRSPVGRTNVAPLMRKKRAVLGAERSGHYFFKDFNYSDNAILAFLTLLKALSENPRISVSKLVLPYKKYKTLSELSIAHKKSSEKRVIALLEARYRDGKSSRKDGLTIDYPDWWFNLRVSNTEDLWRLSIEGDNADVVEREKDKIIKIIEKISKVKDIDAKQ